MKHEQVVPDYVVMLESSITVLALVGCGWLLFKLVSACIWFPQYMKNLELEAEKANQHLENKLLPKKAIYDDDTADSKVDSTSDVEAEASKDEDALTSKIKQRNKSKPEITAEPETATRDEDKKEK